MKWMLIPLLAGVITAAPCYAQTAPGATGECKDGSSTSADSKRGACSGHGGIKTWYGKQQAKQEGSSGQCNDGSYTAAENKSGACSGHGGVKDWYGKDKAAAQEKAPERKSAASGSSGPGRVWVNTESKVYHCSGDRWYGKTKQGEY